MPCCEKMSSLTIQVRTESEHERNPLYDPPHERAVEVVQNWMH